MDYSSSASPYWFKSFTTKSWSYIWSTQPNPERAQQDRYHLCHSRVPRTPDSTIASRVHRSDTLSSNVGSPMPLKIDSGSGVVTVGVGSGSEHPDRTNNKTKMYDLFM
jgi:hypothetical protein